MPNSFVNNGYFTVSIRRAPQGTLSRRGNRFGCSSRGSFIVYDLLQALDAVMYEGGAFVLANAVDVQQPSSGNMLIQSQYGVSGCLPAYAIASAHPPQSAWRHSRW